MKLLLDFSCFVNRVNECMDQLHSPQRKRGLILTKRLNQLAIRRSRCGRSYGVWMRVRCCISCLNVFVYREKIFQMHMCVCLYVRMNVYVSAPTCRSMCGGWASEAGVHAGLSIRRAERIFPPNPIFKNCSFLRSCK